MTIMKAESPYPIYINPPVRSENNFVIKYRVEYSTNSSESSTKYYHTECKYYEISRCGDGVVDTNYDEVCDPGDTTHS